MRPTSIVWFERLYLLAMALGILGIALKFPLMARSLESVPGAPSSIAGLVAFLVLSFSIPLVLWFFVAKRASNLAKWLLVVMALFGWLSVPASLANPINDWTNKVLILVLTPIQFAAIFFLFRRDARDWLESKGRIGPTDPDVFS